jgi:hypothetical protein
MEIHPHHGLSTQDVVYYLGRIVGFELHDGGHVEGRVIAADHEHVYLVRTSNHKVALHDIKKIDKYPPL